MGAYASQPVTECESIDNEGHKVRFGASSMQGWRRTQEDAMTCSLRFDEEQDSMLFAVYDGHGGSEVAEYCARNLPNFIKELNYYKEGKIEEALIEAFIAFDATLVNDDTVSKLKLLANRPESPVPQNFLRLQKENLDDESDEGEEDSDHMEDGEDETAGLLEDACTPIDQVLKKLTNGEITEPLKSGSNTLTGEILNVLCLNQGKHKQISNSSTASSSQGVEPSGAGSSSIDSQASSSGDAGVNGQPGEGSATSTAASSSAVVDSPDAGCSGISTSSEKTVKIATQQHDSDDSDESSDGPDYNENEEETTDDNEEDESEEDEETTEKIRASQAMAIKFTESDEYVELPGSDSGCTACLALLRGNKLYVANAGDSRCVLSSNGVAKDLSVDHKPEDEVERTRIEKAGGFVSPDGRVNGNLNLSRALGDHNYKRVKDLPLRDQMITPLPDIRVETLTSEDEFIIIACDGIWNSLSSQECVDFVKIRIEQGEKLSTIAEDLFHSVLADDTMEGDGTGCDNMTCIIIDLQKCKRPNFKNERTSSTGFDHDFDEDSDAPVSPHPGEPPAKVQKTE